VIYHDLFYSLVFSSTTGAILSPFCNFISLGSPKLCIQSIFQWPGCPTSPQHLSVLCLLTWDNASLLDLLLDYIKPWSSKSRSGQCQFVSVYKPYKTSLTAGTSV
jgi:hypothetical protein